MRIIPGVTAETHAHVLTGHESSKFGLARAAAELIRRIERSPGCACRDPCPRRIADPRGRAVRSGRRARGCARRVPRLRPRRRARRPVHLRRRAALRRRVPGRARRRSARAPPGRCGAHHRAGPEHGRRGGGDAVPRQTVKRGARTFVAVDGGMGDNLEVALYGQRFEAGIATAAREQRDGDRRRPALRERRRARRQVAMPTRVGDLVGVPVTGAYCFTMANNYNGNRRIPVVFAADGAARRSCGARRGPTCSPATSVKPGHPGTTVVGNGSTKNGLNTVTPGCRAGSRSGGRCPRRRSSARRRPWCGRR